MKLKERIGNILGDLIIIAIGIITISCAIIMILTIERISKEENNKQYDYLIEIKYNKVKLYDDQGNLIKTTNLDNLAETIINDNL